MIKWARNLLSLNIFTRATHLSHPQTLTGKKNGNFRFSQKYPLFWIGLTKTAPNDPKWPPKPQKWPSNAKNT